MSDMIEQVARAVWPAAFIEGLSPEETKALRAQPHRRARAAIEAMREPTVDQVAAALPCERDQEFSHEDKCLGAAVCLKLGGAADVGIFEGEAVKQAAFLARDYRIMIDAALKPEVRS